MNKNILTLIRLGSYALLATAVFVSVLILIQGAALFIGNLIFVATGSDTLAAAAAAIFCMLPMCLVIIRSLLY